jgi:hypothetical protein
MPRVGFCDITGQTNERSMLAALVPAGVLCGNKVPTMVFSDTNDEDRLFLWLAVANSLPFDWMLRRIVTTTVNYFLLRSLPFPKLVRNSLRARRLISAAQEIRQLSEQGQGGGDPLRIGQLRAEIDVQVAAAYGLGYSDLELILEDFPLLDRSQQPIRGESRSRVTADVLLYRASRMFKIAVTEPEARVDEARKAGAAPYVPSESISEDGEHTEA